MDMHTALLLMFLVTIFLVGALTALTPWLMKKRECFAVTIPQAYARDARLRRFKLHYSIISVVAALVLAGIIAALFAGGLEELGLIALVIGVFAQMGLSFALMLYYRRRVQAIKRDQGWVVELQESAALIGEASLPKVISLKWNLLYIPLLIITAAIGLVGYDSLPDMVPMHVGLDGQVNDWAPKGLGVVLFPVAIQLFFVVCFVFCHWTMLRSKKAVDPEAPASTALAYGLFARAQSIFLLAAGLLMCAAMILIPLSFLGLITLVQAAGVIVILLVPVLVGAIVVSVVYGQSGARAIKHFNDADELLFDDDAQWKLGVFYYNPADPNLFLPERFGIGWTCNLARPAVWALIIGGGVLTVGFIVAITLMLGW
ncbi:MAG: DUF1648 domain-containing protein [Raoultibacter sp.]